jgi:hypothetical protein
MFDIFSSWPITIGTGQAVTIVIGFCLQWLLANFRLLQALSLATRFALHTDTTVGNLTGDRHIID